MNKVETVLGGMLVPILLAGVIALLSAVAGFFGAFEPAMLIFRDGEPPAAVALITGILVAMAVFVLVLRWIVRQSSPPANDL